MRVVWQGRGRILAQRCGILRPMRALLCACVVLLLPVLAHAALPGDPAEGKSVHDINCTGCHDTSVYARPDRRVHSLDALKKLLPRCERAAGTDFSANERRDLLKYLNESFYRFR